MATRRARLYQGEDMSPVLDYTDDVIWEESEFGTRAWQGEGSSSTVVIRDPLGEQGSGANLPSGLTAKSLASKNLFVIDLDAAIMYRGRVGIKNYSRDNQLTERYRQVECALHDTHWDLDHIFVHNYARPSETGNARVQGVMATYLSGSPRPTTDLNGSNYLSGSNTVMLPAQTFKRTTPLGIIRETGLSENKQFFMTGDALGGGSMFYDGNDSTIYQAGIRISDRPSEILGPVVDIPIGSLPAHPTIPTPNGDFETGDGTNWSGVAGGHILAGDPSGVGGSWFAQVNTLSPLWYYAYWDTNNVQFQAGTPYTLSLWVNGGSHVYFGDIGTGDWVQGEWDTTQSQGSVQSGIVFLTWTPSATSTNVRLVQTRNATSPTTGGSGELIIDQVVLLDTAALLTFPPIWNVGPASTEDGSEQLCEAVVFYGAGGDAYVTAHDLVVHTQYGHSSETFTDDTIPNASEAQQRANSILAHRQYEDKTYNVTVGPLTDAQVLLVKHGQTIPIKARAIPDADDQFRTMRIVQCRYTTPVVGTWFVHLQLGRPWKLAPYGTGAPLSAKSGAAADVTPEPIGIEGSAGTDNGEYATADHAHAHGTIANIPGGTTHPAVDVSITDAGGHFTGTEVETALQELGAAGNPAYASLIKTGSADPSAGAGVASGTGSIYLRTNGTLWVKFGSGDTDWREVINT